MLLVYGVILLAGNSSAAAILIAAALWGISFGGASAQLQAALTTAGGENADVASAFLPVAFNIAISPPAFSVPASWPRSTDSSRPPS